MKLDEYNSQIKNLEQKMQAVRKETEKEMSDVRDDFLKLQKEVGIYHSEILKAM